ncbi:hypothetical protein J2Z40_002961 [Cytobacillus eiseniae]|uniref:Uncharacterized protein n=1 Tax=Cytobacillus eiseniae TaxID=762947 RepID=A0ABS4RKR5_9BACI|nr:hypothetical protein [Cytobacillus eiseniae]
MKVVLFSYFFPIKTLFSFFYDGHILDYDWGVNGKGVEEYD